MFGLFASLAPSIRKSMPSAWVTTMIFVSGAAESISASSFARKSA